MRHLIFHSPRRSQHQIFLPVQKSQFEQPLHTPAWTIVQTCLLGSNISNPGLFWWVDQDRSDRVRQKLAAGDTSQKEAMSWISLVEKLENTFQTSFHLQLFQCHRRRFRRHLLLLLRAGLKRLLCGKRTTCFTFRLHPTSIPNIVTH